MAPHRRERAGVPLAVSMRRLGSREERQAIQGPATLLQEAFLIPLILPELSVVPPLTSRAQGFPLDKAIVCLYNCVGPDVEVCEMK